MSSAASFSRVGLYKKCPASYEWQYLLGNKEYSPGPAAQRGTEIHNSIEDFYNGISDQLHTEIPIDVRRWVLEHHNVPECECIPEMRFALTKDWEPCDFEANEAYIRGLMDNVFIYPDRVIIHEYKTGQEYEEHDQQKQLYALAGLVLFPDISNIEVVGIYIDKKKRKPTTYSRAHLHSMKYTWKREIDKLSLPLYPARPGMHCRWCPKSNKKEGGICPLG